VVPTEIGERAEGPALVDRSQLIYVGDPMCSWCWGFAPVLREVARHYDVRIRTVVGGLRTGPAAEPMGPEERTQLGLYWRQVAERTGQTFTAASIERAGWTYDTEPSCVAVVAMREIRPEVTLSWMTRLQRAFYVEGVDITDLSVFPRIAEEFDVEEQRFTDVLWAEATWRRTQADFDEARSLGILGFPTLLVRDGEQLRPVTRGYAPWEHLEPALTRLLGPRRQR
jgi:putative protein-disulfide isomerase